MSTLNLLFAFGVDPTPAQDVPDGPLQCQTSGKTTGLKYLRPPTHAHEHTQGKRKNKQRNNTSGQL